MAHDATESELARLLAWRPRPPADPPAEAPPPAAGPDAATLGALLDDLSELRLGLAADMGLLASAVEMRAYDIAAEVVDGGRDDLGAFASRSGALLQPEPSADLAAAPSGADPVAAPARRRSWLLRAALPAAPALAAAAALVGVLAGLAPSTSTPAPGPSSLDAAAASYAQLYRLHERGASESALRDAAHDLHAEVARVMALATTDPDAAEQALRLLATEVTVVEDDDQRADLRSVLAESQRLIAVLEAAVSAVSAVPGEEAARVLDGVAPTPLPQPAPLPSSGSAPSPSPEPEPRQPAPTPGGETPPGEEPTSSPSPSPAPTPGLFPPGGVTAGTGSVLPPGTVANGG